MSKISRKLAEKIRQQAKNRCGYCLLPQNLNPTLLEIEHLHPTAAGGTDAEENLWLACRECNSHKSVKTHGFEEKSQKRVKLFNPRTQNGDIILNFRKTKTKSSAKPFAAEQRSKP